MLTESAPRSVTVASPTRRRQRPFPLRLLTSRNLRGYAFISPWLVGFVVFTLVPFVSSFGLSLTEWDFVHPAKYVGLDNFTKMVGSDQLFRITLANTVYYSAFSIPGIQIIALLLALILNQQLRGIALFRTIFYLPSVITGVATAFLWMQLFNPRIGMINNLLERVGIEGPNWLASMTWSMPALIIMSFWGCGPAMIIYLASLQGVPVHLYEAAEVDGAGTWAKFRNVTLPMISPAMFFNLVMGVIGSFQVFTAAFIMTDGGPANRTLFYTLYLFREAFYNFHMGYASALAWMLFLIILLITLLQLAVARRWVYYEGGTTGVR